MELIPFISKNWMLFSALAAVTVLIAFNEINSKKAGTFLISVMETLKNSNDDEAVLIDIRSSDEFKKGHLPNAQNIPSTEIEKKLGDFDRFGDKKVILYCATDVRSTQACNKLKKSNREAPVYSMVGGLNAWKQASLPLSKSKK